MIKKLLALLCGLILTIIVHGQECIQPDKLIFSVIPSNKKKSELTLYQPIANAITEQFQIPVELKKLNSYQEIVSELITGNVHFARIGPFSYITVANMNSTIKPFALHYHAANPPFQEEGSFYYSILIVHADSSYHDIESLRGKTILLTEQGSTSGVLVPRVLFSKQVKANKLNDFFSSVTYSGGHDTSVIEIANQKYDAAFISARNLSLMIKKGLVEVGQFRVLWKSPPIPYGPYVYNTDLCEPYLKAIRHVAFDIHNSADGKTMLKTLGALRLAPTSADNYDVIRELSKLKH
ncbi:phosphate/phosphite/phosphonate ABC transporter substrate-binding protein [Candidatus Albibeggiatoa sp. nov. BB20]|uniref:phosphate/phosphite/phosphonate ABC transporter substrate-binding protein n=1 Tax=Candidatus Albibeggiatoa sp. nov. BB20 TaxID=3162723 RepID=UPI0033658CD6